MCPTPNDFSNYQFPVNRNTGGDVSPTAGAPAVPEVSANVYPNYGFDPQNSQFTTRPEFATEAQSVPEILLEETRAGIEAHAELLQAYGLTQPIAGLGVHSWLRDSLSPGPGEPGNEEPFPGNNTPFAGGE